MTTNQAWAKLADIIGIPHDGSACGVYSLPVATKRDYAGYCYAAADPEHGRFYNPAERAVLVAWDRFTAGFVPLLLPNDMPPLPVSYPADGQGNYPCEAFDMNDPRR